MEARGKRLSFERETPDKEDLIWRGLRKRCRGEGMDGIVGRADLGGDGRLAAGDVVFVVEFGRSVADRGEEAGVNYLFFQNRYRVPGLRQLRRRTVGVLAGTLRCSFKMGPVPFSSSGVPANSREPTDSIVHSPVARSF